MRKTVGLLYNGLYVRMMLFPFRTTLESFSFWPLSGPSMANATSDIATVCDGGCDGAVTENTMTTDWITWLTTRIGYLDFELFPLRRFQYPGLLLVGAF